MAHLFRTIPHQSTFIVFLDLLKADPESHVVRMFASSFLPKPLLQQVQ